MPSEALVYTMKGDQKYFPVYDNAGKLLPNFIFVANIESKDPQQIISGNEKVVRPRLADAEFFFNTDRKNVWKTTCRVWKPCCSSSSWGRCATRPIAFRRWRAWIAEQIGADVNHATPRGPAVQVRP
ncbi:glycine--tRNA ligase subunit beta [Klebsiella pneumoniae subsp. pneumoniae]|nr:glycine--tRNA ligase subunit beta [Klebsiella pneumoniae subsp. pneumoniae]